MSKIIRSAVLMLFLGTSPFTGASDLPVEVRLDILKTKLAKQIKAEDYNHALLTIRELRSLGIKLPVSMDYFEGKALLNAGRGNEAREKLTRYIKRAGRSGKYYKSAIQALISSEDVANAQKASSLASIEKELNDYLQTDPFSQPVRYSSFLKRNDGSPHPRAGTIMQANEVNIERKGYCQYVLVTKVHKYAYNTNRTYAYSLDFSKYNYYAKGNRERATEGQTGVVYIDIGTNNGKVIEELYGVGSGSGRPRSDMVDRAVVIRVADDDHNYSFSWDYDFNQVLNGLDRIVHKLNSACKN